MADILIADDSLAVRRALQHLLLAEGFTVRSARDGEEAVDMFAAQRPDLVLLDVDMPRLNGFGALEEIRRHDRLVPILFLTAMDAEVHAVRALGMGADDYIVKGGGESSDQRRAELVSRIRRALARSEAYLSAGSVAEKIKVGYAEVNFTAMSVREPQKKSVPMTRAEGVLLRKLAGRRGAYISYNELLDHLVEEGYEDPTLHTLQNTICEIKRKLGLSGSAIVTERGHGYMLLK